MEWLNSPLTQNEINQQMTDTEHTGYMGAVRRKDTGGRRNELIAAAARLIAREGVAAATTRRIAAEAGIPLGKLHYWFAGKDDLLAAVIGASIDEIRSVAAAAAQTHEDGEPELEAAFRAAWRIVQQDNGRQMSHIELTIAALRTPGMAELARKQYVAYREASADVVKACCDPIPPNLPGGLNALAQLVGVVFDGATLAWLADPKGSNPEEVFALLSYLVDQATRRS